MPPSPSPCRSSQASPHQRYDTTQLANKHTFDLCRDGHTTYRIGYFLPIKKFHPSHHFAQYMVRPKRKQHAIMSYLFVLLNAFLDNQWISMLVAITLLWQSYQYPLKCKANFLVQQNTFHCFAYFTASSKVITNHYYSCMLTRMGQAKTQ